MNTELSKNLLKSRGRKVRAMALVDLDAVAREGQPAEVVSEETVNRRRRLGLPPLPPVQKTGRPALSGVIRVDVISYRPDPDTLQRMLAKMKETGWTRSEIINKALHAYLRAKE